MSFISDRKKQIMQMLIIASALLPIYITYITFSEPPISLSVFSIVYATAIVFLWLLYYFDFFIKKPTIDNSKGHLTLNNEEVKS